MKEQTRMARIAYKEAAEDLIEAVKSDYPIGAIVTVTIGRSTFPAKIISHSDAWWSDPGAMIGTNVRTGKHRRFYPDNVRER